MDSRRKILIAGAAIVVGGLAVGAGTVAATGTSPASDAAEDRSEGPDTPITGTDLERASAVALEFTGEGRVTDTEVGDEESYYEVEVTLDDGSEVDVQLDEAFRVVGTD